MKPKLHMLSNINRLLLFVALSAVIFSDCKKNSYVIPTLQLIKGDITDSSIAGYNDSLYFKTNIEARFTKTNKGPGSISSDGYFKAGNTEGVVTITAEAVADSANKLQLLVLVTKYATLFKEMKNGGYVISFRHTHAINGNDIGINAFEWWKSCDSGIARQLTSPTGYTDADRIGKVLQLLQRMYIMFDGIMTSEFCRCKQTAVAFNLKGLPITEDRALTYFVYDEPNRYANTMALYSSLPINRNNFIAVTHGGYSGNLPAQSPLNQLAWGDAAIFNKQSNNTPLQFVSFIPLNDWLALAKR